MSGNRFIDDSFLNDFTMDELKILINKHDTNRVGLQLRKRYSRLWYIDENNILYDDITSANLKIECIRILNVMGFTQNTLFKNESNSMINRLYDKFGYNFGVKIELLALVLVVVILDYYHVKYDELKLIDLYDIDIRKYSKLKKWIDKWCKINYWIN